MDAAAKKGSRTTVTINRHMQELLVTATVEATKRAGLPIKQSELINYLIKHKLEEAIEGVLKEKGL
ncbi:TPA: hypothetical protein ACWSGV_004662 [Escherichia coli]|nr:hypothetical protein [Klebsiella pneumoniae]